MRSSLRFPLLVILAGSLHIALGWEWTAAAGLAAGYWIPRRGWLAGAAVVGLDYAFFVAYSFARNASAVQVMAETMGGFLGNLPSFAVVALTLLIGIVIGVCSGAAGTQLNRMIDLRRNASRTVQA